MKTAMSRFAVIAAGMLWAGALLAATPIDEVRPVDADAKVRVENVSGSVEVSGWDRNEVHVTGELGDGVEDLVIEGGGDRLNVLVKHPRNARNVEATHLVLKVPAAARLEVDAVSADVSATGLTGRSLELNSVSGDVTADAETGSLQLNSVSGDVVFRGRADRARLETVSGDIEASGLGGEVRVKSVSGDAELEDVNATSLEMESVSGELTAYIASPDIREVRAKSLSGEVDLHLPASLSAGIRAETYSGEIESDFGETHDDGRRLRATAGGGDGRIEVESFSGDITIRKR